MMFLFICDFDFFLLHVCFSAETNWSCAVCCRSSGGACGPYRDQMGDFLFLRKGKPCTVGFCDGAVRRRFSQRASGVKHVHDF